MSATKVATAIFQQASRILQQYGTIGTAQFCYRNGWKEVPLNHGREHAVLRKVFAEDTGQQFTVYVDVDGPVSSVCVMGGEEDVSLVQYPPQTGSSVSFFWEEGQPAWVMYTASQFDDEPEQHFFDDEFEPRPHWSMSAWKQRLILKLNKCFLTLTEVAYWDSELSD